MRSAHPTQEKKNIRGTARKGLKAIHAAAVAGRQTSAVHPFEQAELAAPLQWCCAICFPPIASSNSPGCRVLLLWVVWSLISVRVTRASKTVKAHPVHRILQTACANWSDASSSRRKCALEPQASHKNRIGVVAYEIRASNLRLPIKQDESKYAWSTKPFL